MTATLAVGALAGGAIWLRCVRLRDRADIGEALAFAVAVGCTLGLVAGLVTGG